MATVCIGRVKEYCPYKDWSTQMPPKFCCFPPEQPLKTNFSTLCLAECVLFCFKFVRFEVCCGDKIVIGKACGQGEGACGHD